MKALTINIVVHHQITGMVAPNNGYTVLTGWLEACGEGEMDFEPTNGPAFNVYKERPLLSLAGVTRLNDGKKLAASRLIMDNCDDIITDCPIFVSCEGVTTNKHHFKG